MAALYVHEMGHVAALRRLGIAAEATGEGLFALLAPVAALRALGPGAAERSDPRALAELLFLLAALGLFFAAEMPALPA